MRKQIVRVAPWQAGKLAGVLYFIMGVVFALFTAIGMLVAPAPEGGKEGQAFGWVFVVLMPFLYAFAGLIFVPITCWLYNLVAKWIGGIEVSVEDASEP